MNPERLIVGGRHRGDVDENPRSPEAQMESYIAEVEAASVRGSSLYSADFVSGLRHAVDMFQAFGFLSVVATGDPVDLGEDDREWVSEGELEVLLGLEQLPNAAGVVLALRDLAHLKGVTVQELLG